MLKAWLQVHKNNQCIVSQPSRSLLVAFPSLMARQWVQANDDCYDTAGNLITADIVAWPFWMCSMGGYGRAFYRETGTSNPDSETLSDEQGIVIGSSSTAVTPDQYALQTHVRSGDTTGTVLYYGTALYGLTVDAGTDTASFYVEAMFENKSGGSININEIGIYANGDTNGDVYPNQQKYCIARDVITTIALADTENMKVTYTISIAT